MGTDAGAIEACLAGPVQKGPSDAAPCITSTSYKCLKDVSADLVDGGTFCSDMAASMATGLALPTAAITRAAWKAALSFEREDRRSRRECVGRIIGRVLGLFMWSISQSF
ncbi:hypothetical protein TARUN_621 [Trichoderma arundinaceum]|uniref:Uncharacterized protein n=1 Tax=Trichoderma arundinaceum TaxID=490622 RepID=A0A395P010_TRIAR|nr:hypothetical protein TARUN_621 [Trichoderma arundinaceum]